MLEAVASGGGVLRDVLVIVLVVAAWAAIELRRRRELLKPANRAGDIGGPWRRGGVAARAGAGGGESRIS